MEAILRHICHILITITTVNDQYWVEESATIIVGLLNNTEADFDTSLNLLSILKVRLASPEEQARFVKKVGIESLLSFMAASFVRFEGNDGICR